MNCKLVGIGEDEIRCEHYNICFADAFLILQRDLTCGVIIEYCSMYPACKEHKPKIRVIKYKKSGLYRIR